MDTYLPTDPVFVDLESIQVILEDDHPSDFNNIELFSQGISDSIASSNLFDSGFSRKKSASIKIQKDSKTSGMSSPTQELLKKIEVAEPSGPPQNTPEN